MKKSRKVQIIKILSFISYLTLLRYLIKPFEKRKYSATESMPPSGKLPLRYLMRNIISQAGVDKPIKDPVLYTRHPELIQKRDPKKDDEPTS